MQEEMKSLYKNGTWELIPPPANKKIVSSKWLFKKKEEANLDNACYKTCLEAEDYNQVKVVDYTNSFSLVVKYTTIYSFYC